jgi:hypothetical protein
MASEVVVGLFTLGGTALGAGLTLLTDRTSWRRSEAAAVRQSLAELYPLIFGETEYGETRVALARLRLRLEVLSVDMTLADNLELAIRKCRSYIDKQVDEGSFDPDYGPGLNQKLLREYEAAVRAIADKLKRKS